MREMAVERITDSTNSNRVSVRSLVRSFDSIAWCDWTQNELLRDSFVNRGIGNEIICNNL